MEHQLRGTSGVEAGDTVVAPFTRGDAGVFEDGGLEQDGTVEVTASQRSPEIQREIDLDLEEAFEHRAELTEICRRIVGDTALAEDVVQETYLQAVKNIHKLERRDGLMPWLVTVATRRSLNELRRRKYSTVVEEMPERQTAPEFDPCVAVTLTDEFDRVNSIMSTLTKRERDLLMKQVYDGLTLVELAELEGSSAASVRSVLSRARSKIKTAIAQSGARILLPFTILAEKARRRLEPVMMRVDRFEIVTTAAISPAEVIGAGVLSLGLALGAPVGGFLSSDTGAATTESTTASTLIVDGESGGSGTVLGRSAEDTGGLKDATPSGTSDGLRRAQTGNAQGNTGADDGSDGGNDDGLQPGLPPLDPGQQGGMPGTPQAPPVEPESPYRPAESPDEVHANGDGDNQMQEGDDGTLFFIGTIAGDCSVGCQNLFLSTDGGYSWTRAKGKGLGGADQILVPRGDRSGQIFAVAPTGLKVSHDNGDHFESVVGMASAGPAAISPRYTQGERRVLIGSSPALEWNGEQASPVTSTPPSAQKKHFAFSPEFAQANVHGKGGEVGDEAEAMTEAPMLFTAMVEYDQSTGAPFAGIYGCTVTAGQADVCDQHASIPEITNVPRVFVSSTFDRDHAVFVWGDGGAFRSTDRGRTFTTMEMPFQAINSIIDDGDGRFYAAGFSLGENGRSGGVAISRDAGKTWRVVGGDSPALAAGTAAVEVLSDGRIIAAPLLEGGGGVWCSSDAGETWARRCAPRAD